MYKVYLKYFKESGKYIGEETYNSSKDDLFRIFDEVKERQQKKYLPGMKTGHDYFIVLIDVPSHPYNHPHIVV